MTRKSLNLDDKVYDYLLSVSLSEHDVLRQCREETASHPLARMQIAPEQGQFMAFLVKALNVQNIIEIGVFTGYSSLAMALALPEDGQIIACDHNEQTSSLARSYWQQADIGHKIELRLAPALETLEALSKEHLENNFDFAFIDAHKPEYIDYYEKLLPLIRTGGVIAVDNVLWSGLPADPSVNDEDTIAIRQFNAHLKNDDRVMMTLLPLADGITLILKK